MKQSKSNLYLLTKNQTVKSQKLDNLLSFSGGFSNYNSPTQRKQVLCSKTNIKKEQSKKVILTNECRNFNIFQNKKLASLQNNEGNQEEKIYKNALFPLQNAKLNKNYDTNPSRKAKLNGGEISNNQINIKLNLNNEIINNNYHNNSKEKLNVEDLLKEKNYQIEKLKKQLIDKQKMIDEMQSKNLSMNHELNRNNSNFLNKNLMNKLLGNSNQNTNNVNNQITSNSTSEIRIISAYKNIKNPSMANKKRILNNNTSLGSFQGNNMNNFNLAPSTCSTNINNNNLDNYGTSRDNDMSNKSNSTSNICFSNNNINSNNLNNLNNQTNVRHSLLSSFSNSNYLINSHFLNSPRKFQMKSPKTTRFLTNKKFSNTLINNVNNCNYETSPIYCLSGPSSPNNTNSNVSMNHKVKHNTQKLNKAKKLFSSIDENYLELENVNSNLKYVGDDLYKKMKSDENELSAFHKKNNLSGNQNLNKHTLSNHLHKSGKISIRSNYKDLQTVNDLKAVCNNIKSRAQNIFNKYLIAIQNAYGVGKDDGDGERNNHSNTNIVNNTNITSNTNTYLNNNYNDISNNTNRNEQIEG